MFRLNPALQLYNNSKTQFSSLKFVIYSNGIIDTGKSLGRKSNKPNNLPHSK